MDTVYSFERALITRSDLDKYGSNKLLLFALEIYREIDDIDSAAINSLTDGSGDKKCDLVHIEREQGYAIIAQGYHCEQVGKKEAPANKASDLNTAVSWLFSQAYEKLPTTLRAAAMELNDALMNKEITTLEIWYVHNLHESQNIKDELLRVKATTESLISSRYKNLVENLFVKEIGLETLENWYRGTKAPILVSDTMELKLKGGYFTEGDNWSAYSTTIPGIWLHNLYAKHGKDLLSANVRDYLGSRRSDRNINNNMKNSAQKEPLRFWVYNNGITAIVNDFNINKKRKYVYLTLRGIAIVNGAQTTGAIGSVDVSALLDVYIPARFVKCSDITTIQRIIHHNNTQNKLEATDFRSNDPIQQSLRDEFAIIPGVEYAGGRRGSNVDQISRPSNLIPSFSAGQALASFYQEPAIAYNEKSNIWQSDTIYPRIFHENITARHLLFAYSLLKSIEQVKLKLRNIPEPDRTATQKGQVNYFELRGSVYLLISAIAASLEVYLNRAIPIELFKTMIWKDNISLQDAMSNWSSIIEKSMPFVHVLGEAISDGRLSKEVVEKQIIVFSSLLDSTKDGNKATFERFANLVDFI